MENARASADWKPMTKGCQVCVREPAYDVIAHQIPPFRYRLCSGCCFLWVARGIEVSRVPEVQTATEPTPSSGSAVV